MEFTLPISPQGRWNLSFCTDFRKVNAVTKPDSFPLPRMEDCVTGSDQPGLLQNLIYLRDIGKFP